MQKCEIEVSTISIIRFRGHRKGLGDSENALKHTHTHSHTHVLVYSAHTFTHTHSVTKRCQNVFPILVD